MILAYLETTTPDVPFFGLIALTLMIGLPYAVYASLRRFDRESRIPVGLPLWVPVLGFLAPIATAVVDTGEAPGGLVVTMVDGPAFVALFFGAMLHVVRGGFAADPTDRFAMGALAGLFWTSVIAMVWGLAQFLRKSRDV